MYPLLNTIYSLLNIGGQGLTTWDIRLVLIFVILILWSLVWKGLALWHAAQRGQRGWFIGLLIINTLGILEIIYLFAILKIKPSDLFDTKK